MKELTKLEISCNFLGSGRNVENCWTTMENAEHRIKPRYVRLIQYGSFYEIKLIKSEKAPKFLEIVSTHRRYSEENHRFFQI